MAADTIVFLALTLFQLGGIPLVWQASRGRTGARWVMIALLATNGALTFLSALESAGLPHARIERAYAVLDLPTWALLVAFALARRGHVRGAWTAVAAAGATALAAGLSPDLLRGSWIRVYLEGSAYLVAMAWVIADTARGDAVDRWIAVAFLPRALLFVTQVVHGFLFTPGPPFWPFVGGAALIAIAAAFAIPRLLRVAPGPPPSVVVAAVLLGPADAIAWILAAAAGAPDLVTTTLNYLTLAIARPLFLYFAYAPAAVRAFGAACTFAAGASAAIFVLAPFVGLLGPPSAIVAISVGSLALAVVDARREVHVHVQDSPARPHWQTLLLALYNDDARPEPSPPRPGWTQAELASRTGISRQRISEFASEPPARILARLDLHAPGWRVRGGSSPRLVTTHRGAVPGLRGSWVYYRLTPEGETLAEHLQATPVVGGARGAEFDGPKQDSG